MCCFGPLKAPLTGGTVMRRFTGPSKGTIGRWDVRRSVRCCTAITALAAAVATILSTGALAIGPDLPLQFRDTDRAIEIILDPARIGRVHAERTMYDDGRPVREQRLELAPQQRQDGTTAAEVPLGLDQLSGMRVGFYAVKIAAVGTPAPNLPDAVLLRIERWVYVAVDNSGVRRVSQREYSDAVDPVRDVPGSRGPMHGGGGREARVPLRDTEHGRAVPLGRAGGAVEEREPDGARVAPQDDERRER